jgi:hypothetical protein
MLHACYLLFILCMSVKCLTVLILHVVFRALLPYVEWDRFVTLAGSKSGLRVTLSYLGESQLDKSVASRIMDGTFSIVLSSPEAALTPGFWRQCFTSGINK